MEIVNFYDSDNKISGDMSMGNCVDGTLATQLKTRGEFHILYVWLFKATQRNSYKNFIAAYTIRLLNLRRIFGASKTI